MAKTWRVVGVVLCVLLAGCSAVPLGENGDFAACTVSESADGGSGTVTCTVSIQGASGDAAPDATLGDTGSDGAADAGADATIPFDASCSCPAPADASCAPPSDAGALVYPILAQAYDANTAITPSFALIADGDSIPHGNGAPFTTTSTPGAGFESIASWMLGDGVAYVNVATPGIHLCGTGGIDDREEATVAPVIASHVALGQEVAVSMLAGVNDWGYEDASAPPAVADILACLVDYATKVRGHGARFIATTMYPVNFGGATMAILDSYSQAIRLDCWPSGTPTATGACAADAPFDALFDFNAMPEARHWAVVGAGHPWISSDGLHPAIDLHFRAGQVLAPIVQALLGVPVGPR